MKTKPDRALGMYRLHDGMEAGFVQIGKYVICSQSPGQLWIEVVSGKDEGEGAEFAEDRLEAAIEQFYLENF